MSLVSWKRAGLGCVVVGVALWPLVARLEPRAEGAPTKIDLAKSVGPGLKEHLSGSLEKSKTQAHKPEHIDAIEDSGCPICPVSDAGEIAVLLALRERRLAISGREHQLERREAQLERLSATLDARIAGLDVAMQRLEKKLNIGEAAQALREQQIAAMVSSLSTMTAKKAAPMLAEADPDVASEIMRRFTPARVAALLGAMPANKAGKFLTQAIPPAPKQAPAARQPAPVPPSVKAAGQAGADAKQATP